MKKILYFLVFIGFVSCFLIIKFKPMDNYIINTENIAYIDELYIYGNHLNLKGKFDLVDDTSFDKINLLLHCKNDIKIPLQYKNSDNNISFSISDKLNNGYLLDNLVTGNYNLYIETSNGEEKKYYKLQNKTSYKETEYYSIRKNNELKKFIFLDLNETINLKIENSNNENVYDIVIDPGHGGIDKGACGNGFCETDFTYLISSKIKEKLEQNGLKVKLTREELKDTERLPNYGKNGRVNIANESKAKYLFAIHLNSNAYNDHGFEIYTANNVDYEFASKIANSIVTQTETSYSTNNAFKKLDGVYMRTLQNIDLKESLETAQKNGFEPYDISLDTTYYFIIRETGGYMSGAYKDSREGTLYNYYSNSNVGLESYLLELGYLTSKTDVDNINNNIDKYVDSIVSSILEELNSTK